MSAISGLPALTGSPLYIRCLPQLTAHRGKLLSGDAQSGTPVHAASFIRRREIVLETELLKKPDLPLILVHEIFHFVWARLGNRKRAEYSALLAEERQRNARGELGESAEVRKQLAPGSRDYVWKVSAILPPGSTRRSKAAHHLGATMARSTAQAGFEMHSQKPPVLTYPEAVD